MPAIAWRAVAAKANNAPCSPSCRSIFTVRSQLVTKRRAEPPKRPKASLKPLEPGTKTKSPMFKDEPTSA